MRSLDFLGSSGFSRCTPGCARWILSAPLDSVAAHPDPLAGSSRLHRILSLLTRMPSLDSLGCSAGCARWMLSVYLDSLAAHQDALAGFSRRLWIVSAPLDSLGASGFSRRLWILSLPHPDALAGFSRCSPRSARWILSFLTQMPSRGSLGAARLSRLSPLSHFITHFRSGERVWVSSHQDHRHRELAGDGDKGFVEDPDVENTEPFFEGDHGVTYAFI
jgi:hypothetical protein